MLVIGQNINSASLAVRNAMENREAAFLLELAEAQIKNGAHMLDVNADICADAAESLLWSVQVLHEAGYRLSIDSIDAETIASVYEKTKPKDCIVNSATLRDGSLSALLPAIESGAGVVAMPIDGMRLPDSTEEYMENVNQLSGMLQGRGVPDGRIYMDIMVLPAIQREEYAKPVARLRALREAYPGMHIIAGISNISHGMPWRNVLNRGFLEKCLKNGLDSAILDALDEEIMEVSAAAGPR